ncbi:MAG: beta-ketoacyl synthase N-terminal-like domain-containing protein [Planctomycetia bacterium]|nr:beta-ketoacyl synthase N-terminal-like domain-containing protein [Planctomycetia bacterium]
MINPTRTVITGVGLVSPLGGSCEALQKGLHSQQSAVIPLGEDGSDLADLILYGAPCADFTGDIADFCVTDKEIKRNIRKGIKIMCRETQMAIASAQKALLHAQLDFGNMPQPRVGVMYGSDYMLSEPTSTAGAFQACIDEEGNFHPQWLGSQGLPHVMPLWLLVWLPNMPGCHISILNQFLGPNNSLTMNEAAANATLKYAHDTIARGWADMMITGATGTRLQSIRTFQTGILETLADKNLPPEEASRPFDRNRTGQVLGEGAGTLILESLEHARERKAPILAEFLAGCDTMVGTHSADKNRMNLQPNYRQGFVNVLRKVLEQSGKSIEEIGFIHAHGLGTPEMDRAEAEAIDEVFAGRSTPIPVVAAKSVFGNLGAGSGAVELIAGINALREGVLFPTRNFTEMEKPYRFQVVTNSTTPAGDCFIHLSANFPGQISAALLGRYD